MRRIFIVTYDISDPNRLRRVYKLMLGWGDHIQLSVFHCELNPRELIELRAELSRIIHHTEDQVLLIDVCAVDTKTPDTITHVGRAYTDPERLAIVI